MDKRRIYLGIDVSKKTIDITVLTHGESTHQVIQNKARAIRECLEHLLKSLEVSPEQVFIGVENTGRYSWPVLKGLGSMNTNLYLLSPLHLSRSMGMVRGKTDAVDSKRIASFLAKNIDELEPYKPPREVIEQLSLLLARRNKLLRLVNAENQTKEELSCVENNPSVSFILEDSKATVALLKERIKSVEKEIGKLIASDQELSHKSRLITSVPGAGKVLSWYLLVKTNEFKNINDPRKLACYAGVAPFEHSSGTSVRGRTRVSFFADKMLKKTLHMAALRVIQLDGEMSEYYMRKVKEGKNKMKVINALRNKIVHRIMAVINQNRPYEINYSKNLQLS